MMNNKILSYYENVSNNIAVFTIPKKNYKK